MSKDLTYYIGIDPGASGGIAVLRTSIVSIGMPKTETDLWSHIKEWANLPKMTVFAVLEQVGGYVGGAGQPGSAMFKFGQSYGSIRMALIAAGIPFETVTPQVWQKKLGIPPRNKKKNETKSAFKNRLKAKAAQLFPDEKITLQTADALLISEYCRRKRTGTL